MPETPPRGQRGQRIRYEGRQKGTSTHHDAKPDRTHLTPRTGDLTLGCPRLRRRFPPRISAWRRLVPPPTVGCRHFLQEGLGGSTCVRRSGAPRASGTQGPFPGTCERHRPHTHHTTSTRPSSTHTCSLTGPPELLIMDFLGPRQSL